MDNLELASESFGVCDDDDVQVEADTIFQSLLTEAPFVVGDHGIPHEDILVGSTKSERTKLREGRAFHHAYFASCILAKGFGGFGTYAIERMTGVVRRAGFSTETRQAIVLRIVGAFVRANLWLDPDIQVKVSKPAVDLHKLRRVHAAYAQKLATVPPRLAPKSETCVTQIAGAIRNDLESVPSPDYLALLQTQTPSLILSQLDMVLLGTTPFIILDVCPQIVGLQHVCSAGSSEYNSYVYYHGILNRYLGIQDRFNFALHPNPAVRRAVSLRIWNEIVMPCWKHFPLAELEHFCHLSERVANPWLPIHFFIKHVLAIGPATNTGQHVGWFGKCLIKLLLLLLTLLAFTPIRLIANSGMRFTFAGMKLYLRLHGYKSTHI